MENGHRGKGKSVGKKNLPTAFLMLAFLLPSGTLQKPGGAKPQHFYCGYCGKKFLSVSQLTAAPCFRHPDGANKGRHKPYEGSEKSEYTCKHCGKKFKNIMQMTGLGCFRHPKGTNKGKHAPALKGE